MPTRDESRLGEGAARTSLVRAGVRAEGELDALIYLLSALGSELVETRPVGQPPRLFAARLFAGERRRVSRQELLQLPIRQERHTNYGRCSRGDGA